MLGDACEVFEVASASGGGGICQKKRKEREMRSDRLRVEWYIIVVICSHLGKSISEPTANVIED